MNTEMKPEFGSRKSVVGRRRSAVVWLTVGAGMAAFCGCAVGPDYERPVVDTPSAFRAAEASTTDH